MVNVEVFKPTEELKSIIKSYTIIETENVMETTVLPHLGLVLAIQVSGKVCLDVNNKHIPIAPVTISGLRSTFRSFVYNPNTTTILVSFTESGAYSILSEAVYELFENAEPLEALIGVAITNELHERLSAANSNPERIQLIETFLIKQISDAETDKLVLTAINKIICVKGLCKIGELSSQLNISQDAFEKRFRKIVGSAPKQFLTIVKMKEVIKHPNKNRKLTDLAYTFDFYDQSHFIKQFKDFTGQTPKQFFNQPYVW